MLLLTGAMHAFRLPDLKRPVADGWPAAHDEGVPDLLRCCTRPSKTLIAGNPVEVAGYDLRMNVGSRDVTCLPALPGTAI